MKRFLEAGPHPDELQLFVVSVANYCARQFETTGWSIAVVATPLDAAAMGDRMKTGVFLSAIEMRDLLYKSPQGRQALSDLGFQPFLQQVEGE